MASIRNACAWLLGRSLPGVQRILVRLHITWKRARASIRSPDRDYVQKCESLALLRQLAQIDPQRTVLLYLDEVTVGRQPTLSATYAPAGRVHHHAPRATRSHAAETSTRIVGALHATSGQVLFQQASRIGVATLVAFYQQIVAAFPAAQQILVVQDNWPVHTHPDLLVALQPQRTPFRWYRPASWQQTASAAAQRRWGALQLPIQLIPLPTYASWCNPIEKLWRKLRQEVTHLHRWADDLPGLRAAITVFLMQFATGSQALLRYVGLYTGLIC